LRVSQTCWLYTAGVPVVMPAVSIRYPFRFLPA
jgi:hypothetical protein